jgi:hypothetical protein
MNTRFWDKNADFGAIAALRFRFKTAEFVINEHTVLG